MRQVCFRHFYGPFREAAESPPQFGDRRSYQMDFATQRSLREVALDIDERTDILMVNHLAVFDILWRVRGALWKPTAVYHVSGE